MVRRRHEKRVRCDKGFIETPGETISLKWLVGNHAIPSGSPGNALEE